MELTKHNKNKYYINIRLLPIQNNSFVINSPHKNKVRYYSY